MVKREFLEIMVALVDGPRAGAFGVGED